MKRIIVETGLGKGVEEYGNMGDISMLQIGVDRLHRLFPEAYIEVLTDSAENLERYCPAATPLENCGRALWFSNGVLLGKYSQFAPQWFVDCLVSIKTMIRSRFPRFMQSFLTNRFTRQGKVHEAEAVGRFVSAMEEAGLLILCGAGGFYDGSRQWNEDVLDLIEAAIQRGMPVALLGQGFGPLTDPMVLKRAAKILTKVDFITLRGGRGSLELLLSLGISQSGLETTGDEALDLAYGERSQEIGRALGINIRFLASALTDEKDLDLIKPVLHRFARRHGVPLIPLPIAIHRGTRDDLAIKQVLLGFDEESDGGIGLDTPLKVIRQVGLCRAVVTGAYHAAVFALGQGIPVVALAKSDYFAKKMLGLADMFGQGCQVVLLNEPDLPERLLTAIETAWQHADGIRDKLQTVTLRHIELSRRSYERIHDLAASAPKRSADGSVGRISETPARSESQMLN